MPSNDRPARPAPPVITLPPWWTPIEGSIGKVLGIAVDDAVDYFAQLSAGEQAAYTAVLQYHQLRALAELDTSIRRLEQKIARIGGVTRGQLAALTELGEELLTPPADDGEDEIEEEDTLGDEDPGDDESGDEGGEAVRDDEPATPSVPAVPRSTAGKKPGRVRAAPRGRAAPKPAPVGPVGEEGGAA